MRHILVTNAKGGCGKSTIATNLAAYYASEGFETALADYDPQGSALAWLDERAEDYGARSPGSRAYDSGLQAIPRNTEYLIIDAPARSHGKELSRARPACRDDHRARAALADRYQRSRIASSTSCCIAVRSKRAR